MNRGIQSWRRRKQRRFNKILFYLLSGAELTNIEVYVRTDEAGFSYKGFICTPYGILKFGAGTATVITKKNFKRIFKSSRLLEVSFDELISSWRVCGLWEHRIYEQRLAEAHRRLEIMSYSL